MEEPTLKKIFLFRTAAHGEPMLEQSAVKAIVEPGKSGRNSAVLFVFHSSLPKTTHGTILFFPSGCSGLEFSAGHTPPLTPTRTSTEQQVH